jgi:hypothetical protein
MALTADRSVDNRLGSLIVYKVAAGVKIFAGALIVLDSSKYARPGYVNADLIAVGVSRAALDNTLGAAGVYGIEVEEGIFQFFNSENADLITRAEIGEVCYIIDDQTVAKTNGAGTRSAAGTIKDVDDFGVWVEIKNFKVSSASADSPIVLIVDVLSGTTSLKRVDYSGIDLNSVCSPAWGINTDYPLGTLFISEQGEGYCIVQSTAEEVDDKNIILTIYNG